MPLTRLESVKANTRHCDTELSAWLLLWTGCLVKFLEKFQVSVGTGKGWTTAAILLKPVLGFSQTTGEAGWLSFPGTRFFPVIHPASVDKVRAESLWSAITQPGRRMSNSISRPCGLLLSRGVVLFNWPTWGRRHLAAVVCLERMGETQKAGEGERTCFWLCFLGFAERPGLLCRAWRCPVENPFLTLCGMFY